MTTITGVTWDHPRRYRGLETATAAYTRDRPALQVVWAKHSLHHFEAHPISDLAARYDLIVLDHPFMGDAYAQLCLVDLGAHTAALHLDELATDTVGASFASYRYGDGIWAVPLDASCQMAAYRPELLERHGMAVPADLAGIRSLAGTCRLAMELNDVHALMTFFALCVGLGAAPGAAPDIPLVPEAVGLETLELVREIAGWCPPEALHWNSIGALEALAERDDLVYCPYVFGFSSYSLPTARGRLRFAPVPASGAAGCRASVLGGTGLAISRRCRHLAEALALVRYLTSPAVQKVMALEAGQPARRSIWLDPEVNDHCDGFYRRTLATIEHAYLRPRFPGYIRFQREGGELVGDYLRARRSPRAVLARLLDLHHQLVRDSSAS